MRCQRSGRSVRAAALPSSSCTRFSPKSTCPRAATARTSSAGQVLLTAISRTEDGARPAARAAAATRSRTARRFCSRRDSGTDCILAVGAEAAIMAGSALQPDDPRLTAGDAVAAVGEEEAVLDGASRVVHDLANPGAAQLLGHPGAQVQPRRPGPGADGGAGGDPRHVGL